MCLITNIGQTLYYCYDNLKIGVNVSTKIKYIKFWGVDFLVQFKKVFLESPTTTVEGEYWSFCGNLENIFFQLRLFET